MRQKSKSGNLPVHKRDNSFFLNQHRLRQQFESKKITCPLSISIGSMQLTPGKTTMCLVLLLLAGATLQQLAMFNAHQPADSPADALLDEETHFSNTTLTSVSPELIAQATPQKESIIQYTLEPLLPMECSSNQKLTTTVEPTFDKESYDAYYFKLIDSCLEYRPRTFDKTQWFTQRTRDCQFFSVHEARTGVIDFPRCFVAASLYVDLEGVSLDPNKMIREQQILATWLQSTIHIAREVYKKRSIRISDFEMMLYNYRTLREKPLPEGNDLVHISRTTYGTLLNTYIKVCEESFSACAMKLKKNLPANIPPEFGGDVFLKHLQIAYNRAVANLEQSYAFYSDRVDLGEMPKLIL